MWQIFSKNRTKTTQIDSKQWGNDTVRLIKSITARWWETRISGQNPLLLSNFLWQIDRDDFYRRADVIKMSQFWLIRWQNDFKVWTSGANSIERAEKQQSFKRLALERKFGHQMFVKVCAISNLLETGLKPSRFEWGADVYLITQINNSWSLYQSNRSIMIDRQYVVYAIANIDRNTTAPKETVLLTRYHTEMLSNTNDQDISIKASWVQRRSHTQLTPAKSTFKNERNRNGVLRSGFGNDTQGHLCTSCDLKVIIQKSSSTDQEVKWIKSTEHKQVE